MQRLTNFRVRVMLVALVCSPVTGAPLGTRFTYQGRLQSAGSPASGAHDLRFRLFDAGAGGAQVGIALCLNNVAVVNGLFTVDLDFGAQFAGEARFLEIEVRADTGLDCSSPSGFIILSPRQPLTAAPQALHALDANNADHLDGLDSSAFLQAVPNPLTLAGSNATHIIRGENASTASGSSGVNGVSTAASGTAYGGRFESASTSGRAVFALASAATGTTYGGRFETASTSGRGVLGLANAATGTTYGVYGQSVSASGYGVYGEGSGTGVYGYAMDTTAFTNGVLGRTNSTNGRGVFGRATAATGANYGVHGETYSTAGTGVLGVSNEGTGSGLGVAGYSFSRTGYGVYGWADSGGQTGTNYGVFGSSTSSTGYGVYGIANGASATGVAGTGGVFGVTGEGTYGVYGSTQVATGRGVYGYSPSTTATSYGVRGFCSTASTGYAVYAAGDMGASGVKPFRIDHPLDPENKYLLHYAAESPDVINFYTGIATLDARGEAIVDLPPYFAAINKDPRYLLTAVGAPMPALHVATEISKAALESGAALEPGIVPPACSFRISGGAPGARVSWEVKAVRNDLRMRLHNAPVEQDKMDPERGKFQHPEYYGQPAEKGMDLPQAHARPPVPPRPRVEAR